MLIAIEGTDGAGKATQAKLLAERIRTAGREAVVLSFPRYDTPVGQAIKRLLTGETSLFASPGAYADAVKGDEALVLQALMLADKADAINEIIDHLNDGAVVICDRWIPSALCYGPADGLDAEWLERIHFPLLDADLNIFLDVTPEEALRRRPEARDRFERDREKQAKVHLNYIEMWGCGPDSVTIVQSEPYQYFARVTGMGAPEEVTERIFTRVVEVPAWLEVEPIVEKGAAS